MRSFILSKSGLLVSAVVIVLDQFSKWLVAGHVALHQNVAVIPGVFWISHVENEGAAFGLFADSAFRWRGAGLIIFSLIAMGVVVSLLWKSERQRLATRLALLLILGGATGNLWDRLVHGHVVDFFEVHIGSYHWPDFNVADSAIVIGALLILAEILFEREPAKETPLPTDV